MIAAIETALIEQLRAAADAGQLGYEWGTLETYPDDWDSYLKDKGQLKTPAAWAVFLSLGDGVAAADDAGPVFDAKFALVVASRSLRNETATRHGDKHGTPGGNPGSYQLAEDAARLLSNNDLGLPLIEAVEVVGMRLVARSPEIRKHRLSLMALELNCTISLGLLPGQDGNPGDFAHLHIDWDVPPHGNVTGPLPAANPDMADDIRPEQ